MKIIKPERLRPGDTLGIVAASSPITKVGNKVIERGYSYLRSKGFKIVEAPNCRKVYGHTAGTIKERVSALHDFFEDPKIDGIMAFWGGWQSHQLLEHLDYRLIRKNPKVLVGYSDTTALQAGIFSKTGLVTFSGPATISFCKPKRFQYTWYYLSEVLMHGTSPLKLLPSDVYSDNRWWERKDKKMVLRKAEGWKTFSSGKVKGQIVGGNLGTMLLLEGTDWWPDMRGKILFVEEDEAETPQTVDRLFTRLRHLGIFEQIKGMVVGRMHSDVGFTKKDSFETILKDALKGYDLPVLYNVDFGHTDPLMTIPIGIRCRIDAAKKEIVYLESAVK